MSHSSATDAPPSAEVDAAEAARLKREARKARILSKGSHRLARITNTGRGEGASAYLKDNTPSLPSTPLSNTSPADPLATRADDEDPLEVDVSTLPLQAGAPRGEEATNPFAMFGGASGQGQQNPMEALMAMMQGGGGGGGPFAGGGLGGSGSDGQQQQPDMSGLLPQFAAMMQQFGAGDTAGPGTPTATQKKSISERAFDLLQAILVLALALLAAKSSLLDFDRSSPAPDAVDDAFEKIAPNSISCAPTNTLRRWARLGYQHPSAEEWASVSPPSTTSFPTSAMLPGRLSTLPLFWIFLSLEILLQAARIAIFSRKTRPPPSMLAMLAGMLPIPNLGLIISLVSRYLALVNAFINDLSLLVFVFGVAVLWSGHKLGGVGMLQADLVPAFIHDEF
ncbi:uncharacterized protein UBRO_07847 [Ustilago bromivora]|uniref:Golgi to ER traffic protein 2 n=1 Tax=Ustilago bromivora TaxID=307758 RepID=A0A1K0HF38_9BASI|nr:uncharacterized protein UBRO_07847 [Ustilago bromivora]SYW80529.1 uncharacterized protein UBRO2_03797 [Ustilago bromivora]